MIMIAALASLAGCTTPAPAPENLATQSVGLSQTARFADLRVTPLRIVEDSRCPTGVQCIQAGTVRIEARIESSSGVRAEILKLGIPVEVREARLQLIRVCPYPAHGSRIGQGDYRFALMFAAPGAPALLYNQAC